LEFRVYAVLHHLKAQLQTVSSDRLGISETVHLPHDVVGGARVCSDPPDDDAGVVTAETEGIAQGRPQLGLARL